MKEVVIVLEKIFRMIAFSLRLFWHSAFTFVRAFELISENIFHPFFDIKNISFIHDEFGYTGKLFRWWWFLFGNCFMKLDSKNQYNSNVKEEYRTEFFSSSNRLLKVSYNLNRLWLCFDWIPRIFKIFISKPKLSFLTKNQQNDNYNKFPDFYEFTLYVIFNENSHYQNGNF